jgi:hypothetical protein
VFIITPTPLRRSTCSWRRRSRLGFCMDFSSCGSPASELVWLGCDSPSHCGMACRQLTEACGWDEPPRYVIRDRDSAYGAAFIGRIRAMAIRDRPVSVRRLGRTDMRRG